MSPSHELRDALGTLHAPAAGDVAVVEVARSEPRVGAPVAAGIETDRGRERIDRGREDAVGTERGACRVLDDGHVALGALRPVGERIARDLHREQDADAAGADDREQHQHREAALAMGPVR